MVFPNAGLGYIDFPGAVDRDFSKPPNLIEIDVNLKGVIYTMQAGLDVLRRKPDPKTLGSDASAFKRRWRGKIVCTASEAGIYPLAVIPVYSASKFGVHGVVRATAIIMEPEAISVNCVGPAIVDTAVFAAAPAILEAMYTQSYVTPMSTVLKGFETFLPADVELTGKLIDCSIEDAVIHQPTGYLNEKTGKAWEAAFL